MTQPEKPADVVNEIQKAIDNEATEQIYFNGFQNAVGTGDIVITLQRNGKPVAILNTSYTVAKTLSVLLGDLISKLEKTTGNTIMTTEEIGKSLGN